MPRLYTLLLLLLLIACGSRDNGCSVEYSFEFPLSVTPQDTFSVGDTIWHEMDLPNQLLDKNSGQYIDFMDYELYFDLLMSKSDTNFVYDASHLFDIYAEIGRVELDINYFVYNYVHFKSINEKKFRVGLIPPKKGSYSTSFYLAGVFTDREVNNDLNITDTECWEHLRLNTYAYINNGDANYYLVDGLCQMSPYDSLLICGPDSMNFPKGNFAFYVKD